MASFNTYGTVTLIIDGVTSFSKLLDIKNAGKNMRFSLNKSSGKFRQSDQDGGIVIDYEGFVRVFNLFVC